MSYALVNYEKEKTMLVVNRPDISSKDRLKNELYAELNMSLYGSDSVILSFRQFIDSPKKELVNQLAILMRKDLYGIKTKLKSNSLALHNNE